ncbi:MAG: hypothetical protein K0R63_190 [Rickettsiales bacterium]|jgi:hypothetical protein|nr:hypothetical protein [Rickettsiales bacterium]
MIEQPNEEGAPLINTAPESQTPEKKTTAGQVAAYTVFGIGVPTLVFGMFSPTLGSYVGLYIESTVLGVGLPLSLVALGMGLSAAGGCILCCCQGSDSSQATHSPKPAAHSVQGTEAGQDVSVSLLGNANTQVPNFVAALESERAKKGQSSGLVVEV